MTPPRPQLWIALPVFLFLWGDLIWRLGDHWTGNPQYAFGWTVPLLALFLGWKGWSSRPAPGLVKAPTAVLLGAAMLALALLPTRLFLEATPDWRFLYWALALETIGLSLLAVYWIGGGPWVWQFFFPVTFILVAVPWPVKIEQPFIDLLTGLVSKLTVVLLNLVQIPAIEHGKLIEISAGVLGVEEACSGVRSFQSTLMAALFLGQLWEFHWLRRLFFVISGVVLAFLCNVLRASLLAFVAEKRGITAIATWHDPAGFTILIISFLGLLGIASLLRAPVSVERVLRDAPAPRPLPLVAVAALTAWVLFALAGTELWYRSGDVPALPAWNVTWPVERASFTELPATEEVRQGMRYDEGRQGRWKERDGSEWTMFFFRWWPGLASSRIMARFHRPEICLTAAGLKLIDEAEPAIFQVGAAELAFRVYRFEQSGVPVFVYFCVWEDRPRAPGESPVPEAWTPLSRWHSVLYKKRKLGQQVLEVAIAGYASAPQARREFERVILPRLH